MVIGYMYSDMPGHENDRLDDVISLVRMLIAVRVSYWLCKESQVWRPRFWVRNFVAPLSRF